VRLVEKLIQQWMTKHFILNDTCCNSACGTRSQRQIRV